MVARGLLFTLAILTVSLAFTTSYAQAALSVGNPSASATLVDSGTPVSISSSGASGGTSPYTYTWYEQTPGVGGFYPSGDCSSSTTNCVFSAYGSGTYYFQLQAVDSGNPQQTSKSQTVGITVEPALEATISTANGTIYPGQYDDINVKTSGGVLPYNYQWLGGTVSGDCAAPPVEGTTQGYLTFTPTASEAGCGFEFRAIVTDSAQGSQPITVESTIYVLQLPQNTTTVSGSGGSGSGSGGGSGSSGGSQPGGAIITKNGGQITVSNLSGTPVTVEFEGANISLRNSYSTSAFGHIMVNTSYYSLNIGQAVQIETTPSVMMKLVATKSVQGIYNDQVLLYEGTVAVNSTTSAG